MNYVELHIGDYEKATAHLTACEDGIYGRLIRRYYDTEKPLPADVKAVQRLVRARSKEERQAVETVLEEFFRLDADGWRHGRCDEEIARYQAKREKAQASANARWSKQQAASERNANASETDMRTHCDGNAHQSPVTRHQQEQPQEQAHSRGSRLPQDWQLPDDWRAWAQDERPDLDVSRVAEQFADHWRAKAGKDGRKADWKATWRNWVRNERGTGPPRNALPQPSRRMSAIQTLMQGTSDGQHALAERRDPARAEPVGLPLPGRVASG